MNCSFIWALTQSATSAYTYLSTKYFAIFSYLYFNLYWAWFLLILARSNSLVALASHWKGLTIKISYIATLIVRNLMNSEPYIAFISLSRVHTGIDTDSCGPCGLVRLLWNVLGEHPWEIMKTWVWSETTFNTQVWTILLCVNTRHTKADNSSSDIKPHEFPCEQMKRD
jgi:hypothetical protein